MFAGEIYADMSRPVFGFDFKHARNSALFFHRSGSVEHQRLAA